MSGPSALYDRVVETTATQGTGTLSLAGALNNSCQSFNLVGDGNSCRYVLTDNLTFWELGIGTFTLSGRTLSRATVLGSSNSGSAVSISTSNTVYVMLCENAAVRQKTLFTGTASVTVSTSGDQTLMPAGQGSTTIPANYLQVGKTIRLKVSGYLTTGVTPGNATLTFKLGGSGVINTGAFALIGSLTNLFWEAEVNLTSRTTGVSGTVMINGKFIYEITAVGADIAGMVNTGTTTIDTTSGQAVDFSINFASGGNTMTLSNCSIEMVN